MMTEIKVGAHHQAYLRKTNIPAAGTPRCGNLCRIKYGEFKGARHPTELILKG